MPGADGAPPRPAPWPRPRWPAPPWVRAVTTTREGGVSPPPYATLNLGLGSGDRPEHVARNRARLRRALGLPAEPFWLGQVHGARVVEALPGAGGPAPRADASFARGPGAVCAVLTADCVPVLLADRRRPRVAAAHAGWRGLAAGVLEATLAALETDPADVVAWLGPCIGRDVYEVGDEVREALGGARGGARAAFRPSPAGRWLADLRAVARRRLRAAGVGAVHACRDCTFSEPGRYFSHRREATTGRMATLVWIDAGTAPG